MQPRPEVPPVWGRWPVLLHGHCGYTGNMTHQYILFHLDDQPYALPIASVERVVRAVAVTPVALAPALMLGVINVQGRIVPALNLRKLFGLAECPVAPAHQFLLVGTRGSTVALVVDAVAGIRDAVDPEMQVADTLLPGCRYLGDQDGQST